MSDKTRLKRKRWCPACDKLSGHPSERCPKRPMSKQIVILPTTPKG